MLPAEAVVKIWRQFVVCSTAILFSVGLVQSLHRTRKRSMSADEQRISYSGLVAELLGCSGEFTGVSGEGAKIVKGC